MSDEKQFVISPAGQNQRLDRFLAEQLKNYSRSRLQRLIRSGKITVNRSPVKAHYCLSPGDCITVVLPSLKEPLPAPEPLLLDIIYEDEEIIVINKPAGLLVHPLRAGQGGTLVNALLSHTDRLSAQGGALRRGIVHRLDKDTSGLLVVAKSDDAHRDLSRQFKERTMEKEYRALVCGRPPRRGGEVTSPIGRRRRRRTQMAVKYIGGREARTIYEILEAFPDHSWLRILLKTGRTHQIRVHLAQIGCPVLGDRQYGRRGGSKNFSSGVKRQMLHACRLSFIHPASEKKVEFIAPLPEDIQSVLSVLRQPG